MNIDQMELIRRELLRRLPAIKGATMENGVERIIDLANECIKDLKIDIESDEDQKDLTEFLKPTVKDGLMEILKNSVSSTINDSFDKNFKK
ncbi:MAG: hypothetical protein HRT72_12300 [Flavobacteriales bacterium]|nr:hypothetical protein [Flavobacteriales bacterium]